MLRLETTWTPQRRLRHQFDITVAGGPAVGAVTIAMDTCLRGYIRLGRIVCAAHTSWRHLGPHVGHPAVRFDGERGPASKRGGSLEAGIGRTWRTVPDRLTTNSRAATAPYRGSERDFTWVNSTCPLSRRPTGRPAREPSRDHGATRQVAQTPR